MTGLVVKGIGGFYYVKANGETIECKARGSFKKDGIKLQVGDIVEFEEVDLSAEAKKRGILHEGVINEIHPRKNEFIRPPIANVDSFVVTMAAKKPEPNLALIDKFLIMAEMNDVEAIVLINKADLVSEEELNDLKGIYEGLYPLVVVSAKKGEGISELQELIRGKRIALAGPSGVGKSTILNQLHPSAECETGEISAKTQRGKHTTRHVEIFEVDGGGFVYDTPGFTSFDILEADEDTLQLYYPEIESIRQGCYYDNCRHVKEPDCAVRKALKEGKIHKKRYESYLMNIEEIKNKKTY